MGAFERQLQAVLDRLSARDPGPEHCGRGCICEADLDLNPGQGPDVPAPWNCSLDSDALAARTGQWRALAAAATSAERASGTVRLVLPAGPETITAVAALCAAETACCPHARFLLEVTAGQVTVTVKAAGTTGLPEALFPGQHAPSVMSTTAICLAVLAAAGLVLLLWAIGRAVTAARNRIPPPQRQDRHYLAGRLDRVQITDTLDYDGELLISLTTPDAPLTGVFCVTASPCSLARVRRWHAENTPLRAYLSHDGAVMLADPVLGGNAPCKPPTPDTSPAHDKASLCGGSTAWPRGQWSSWPGSPWPGRCGEALSCRTELLLRGPAPSHPPRRWRRFPGSCCRRRCCPGCAAGAVRP